MGKSDKTDAPSLRLVIRLAKGRRIGGLTVSLIMTLLIGWPFAFYVSVSNSSGFISLSDFITQNLLFIAILLATLPSLGFAIKNMWWGDALSLDETGIRYRINQKRGIVHWQDIKHFRLEAPLLGMREHVGWDYNDEQASAPFTYRRLRSNGNYPTSLHGDLGPYWQGGSLAVRDTLEDWRQRYAAADCAVDRSKTATRAEEMLGVLVIRSAHMKYLGQIMLVSGGLLAGLGVAYAVSPAHIQLQLSWWPAILLALIALAILGPVLWLLVRRYLSRPQITLRQSGFELRDVRGVRLTPWAEVDTFGLIHHPQSHIVKVGWRRKTRTDANRYSAEMDEDLGGGFEGAPEDLRDVLEDWRIRFS